MMIFQAKQLRVNRSRTVRLTDCAQPVLSWAVDHNTVGTQEAFCVRLYLHEDCLWDSGWVASSTQEVKYCGPELESCRTYRWTVQLQDNQGQKSRTVESELKTPWFPLWDAAWITATHDVPGKAVYYRKCFQVAEKTIESATLMVCGLGYQHVTLNGDKTEDSVLSPAISNYSKRCYYTVTDVTLLLQSGQNTLAVTVGEGWRRNEGTYLDHVDSDKRKILFFGTPQMTAMLLIRYKDSTLERILTDNSWQWAHGPIRYSHLFNGEMYDQKLEMPGWDSGIQYSNAFHTVLETVSPGGSMVPQTLEPIREKQVYKPLSVTEPQPRVFVLDFGQNIAGVVRVQLAKQSTARTITLRHAEVLQEDGMLYTAPLRSAMATDTLNCSGEVLLWQPLFTYHGFRYMEITGLDDPPETGMFVAVALYTDIDTSSYFQCGSALVNQIAHNIRQTERANLHSIATDCPQRDERMAWMNDATVRFVEMPYTFDTGALLPKIIRDIRDEQSADGAITCTAPFVYGNRPADPVSSSFLVAGMQALLHHGNREVLAETYGAFKAWNACLATHAPDGIVDYSYYGDWAGPEYACDSSGARSAVTPGILMSTGFHFYNYILLARFAEELGMLEEVTTMRQQAEQIRRAFLQKWWDGTCGKVATGSQGCQAFALWLGILPEEGRQLAARQMVQAIEDAGSRITTGNLCTTYLLEMLCDYGYENTAWQLLTSEEYPSLGYMIQNGATTVWERFELKKDPGMNSHNHPMYAATGSVLYSRIAGILPVAPGFGRVTISPVFPEKLFFAEASLDTCKGALHVKWVKQYGFLHVYVTVPFGITADIHLPWYSGQVEHGFWHFSTSL